LSHSKYTEYPSFFFYVLIVAPLLSCIIILFFLGVGTSPLISHRFFFQPPALYSLNFALAPNPQISSCEEPGSSHLILSPMSLLDFPPSRKGKRLSVFHSSCSPFLESDSGCLIRTPPLSSFFVVFNFPRIDDILFRFARGPSVSIGPEAPLFPPPYFPPNFPCKKFWLGPEPHPHFPEKQDILESSLPTSPYNPTSEPVS